MKNNNSTGLMVSVFVGVFLILLAGRPVADELTDEQKLDKGEILVSVSQNPVNKADIVKVMAVINTQPERVWKLVSDCNSYRKTMPRVDSSKELSRNGNRVVCRVVIDLPFPLTTLMAVTECIHTVTEGNWNRRWSLLSGDYKLNAGSWNLSWFKGDKNRTMVEYKVLVITKMWVPDWARRMGQENTLPKMMKGLRKHLGVSIKED